MCDAADGDAAADDDEGGGCFLLLVVEAVVAEASLDRRLRLRTAASSARKHFCRDSSSISLILTPEGAATSSKRFPNLSDSAAARWLGASCGPFRFTSLVKVLSSLGSLQTLMFIACVGLIIVGIVVVNAVFLCAVLLDFNCYF